MQKKLPMNKSCFTVLYACYKCLQDSWPISFAHGGGPDIYCQRSLFHLYEEKERMVWLKYVACGNHMYLLHQTTNFLQSSKKKV